MCKIVNSNISEVPDVIWSEHSFSKYPGWFIRPNLPKNAETCYNLDELMISGLGDIFPGFDENFSA